jgi:hypothetical protein
VNGGDKGTLVEIDDGLKSTTPANWMMQKPDNKFRVWQFSIPAAAGDKKNAELVVFYFGPGSGGTAESNVTRWKSQFQAPEGKTIDQATKVEEKKVGQTPVTYVDIHGTYLYKFPPFDPNAKVTPLPEYRRLAVVFDSKNGPYFITLTGPAKTVDANKMAFDSWLGGFKK